MGTRGFMGIVINGELKIGYNHSDSYPSGLGEDVLEWTRKATAPDRIDETRRLAVELKLVNAETPPTPDEVERLSAVANRNVGTGELTDWYVLLRETQGDLGAVLRCGFLEDANAFPGDSLFAEWGYLVDLDTETFEVYRGFVTGRAKGRFADLPVMDSGYGPVTLAASWPLSSLPDDLDEEMLPEVSS